MRTAYSAHHGQVDRSGIPYIFHPIHIAEQMDTEDLICVALLHDVLEDSHLTRKDLRIRGFKEEVIEAVELLTKSDKDTYDEYIHKLKSNELAKKVKVEDLKHNMDTERLKKITDKDLARVKKYEEALLFLLE